MKPRHGSPNMVERNSSVGGVVYGRPTLVDIGIKNAAFPAGREGGGRAMVTARPGRAPKTPAAAATNRLLKWLRERAMPLCINSEVILNGMA